MKKLSVLGPQGINALDLIGDRATPEDITKSIAMVEMNFGMESQDEKIQLLAEMIQEDGWSKARLERTLRWFLKSKKFPNWTIADWYDYGVKLYPYSWYLKMINEGVKAEDMEGYRIKPGLILWKLKDGEELPSFEKINTTGNK